LSIARAFVLGSLLLMAAPPAGRAQEPPGTASGDPSAAPGAPPAASEAPPAPGAEASGAPAPEREEAAGYSLPPEKYRDAIAYSRARYRLYFLGTAYGLAVLIFVLTARLAPRFRDTAERLSRRPFVQALVFTPLLVLTTDILGLPTGVYGQHLALKYNQSIQSWGSWLWDFAKGMLINVILATLLVWILYMVIRRSPRRWWFYAWLASLPILVLLVFVQPLIIDPLFFKFSPLERGQAALVGEIEKVVARGGLEIPRERMFEMNASAKLNSVNAYVTGFGASKRVVVWDTTLAKMTPSQTLFVFGHEMGHYVLRHILKLLAFLSVLVLVFLLIGYHTLHRVLRRRGPGWGIRGVDDLASLPALLLLVGVLGFLASPLINSYSRTLEHEADIYGLEVIHGIVPESQRAAAEAFQILGEINLADPDPPAFIKFWRYSHPPLNERVVFARSYDPWSKGEKPRFVPGG
jgi:Zn-dependent protease with chaperone function